MYGNCGLRIADCGLPVVRWGIVWLGLGLGMVVGCGRETTMSVEVDVGQPVSPQSSDPPYSERVVFPSGLRLTLVQDGGLAATYPAPGGNPFGGARQKHYARVLYFIDLPRVSLSGQVTPNFRLSEYVASARQRGAIRAYVDPQVANHVQQIRSGLGRALTLNSGFRTPEHNRAVGGATYSRHIYGDGVDIDVDQNRSDASVQAQEIFNEARDVGVDFVLPLAETSVPVGGEQRVSWVHLDDRGF